MKGPKYGYTIKGKNLRRGLFQKSVNQIFTQFKVDFSALKLSHRGVILFRFLLDPAVSLLSE